MALSLTWRLILIRDVAVPGDGVCPVVQELEERLVISATVDEMDFRIPFRRSTILGQRDHWRDYEARLAYLAG
jgi:hypothetical protein